jgi:hypothetical protein
VYLNVVTWYIFIMFLLVQLPPHLLSFFFISVWEWGFNMGMYVYGIRWLWLLMHEIHFSINVQTWR